MAPQYRSNEQRLTEGNIARIWSVRNFKTVFREIETERRKEDINKKAGTVISSTVLYTSQISTPRTPQNRTYVGLDKIATIKKAEIALMNSLIEDDATYSLKRDNIAPDEDVEKVKELGEIFKRTSNDMNGKQLQLKRKKQVKEAKQK
ncbi:22347_t:CDS:2 [Rhizophagus irregularis]|nr:22347_t:CDS:2 [Rhizophagus irregularis]